MLKYCKQLSNLAQIFVFHCVTLDKVHNFSVMLVTWKTGLSIPEHRLIKKLNSEFVMYVLLQNSTHPIGNNDVWIQELHSAGV